MAAAEEPGLIDIPVEWGGALDVAAAHVVRPEQEARWADARIDGREQLSVREAVLTHRDRLIQAVGHFSCLRALAQGARQRRCLLSKMPQCGWEDQPEVFLAAAAHAYCGQGGAWQLAEHLAACPSAPAAAPRPGRVLVCVRKRPLLPHETAKGEWDAVDSAACSRGVLCHDGRVARNGRRLELCHRLYAFHRVWGESANTAEVYDGAAAPLLQWAQRGRSATLLCYGQTGTGKTYTMIGVLEHICRALGTAPVGVEFFEVRGRRCYDLLRGRAEVRLMSDQADRVHVVGVARTECAVSPGEPPLSPTEFPAAGGGGGGGGAAAEEAGVPGSLRQALRRALSLRAAQETERNAASSRSHAVCQLCLPGGGTLRLVDLAGSERNYETTQMTAAEHRESAEINSALVALKDCFREWEKLQGGQRGRPPFRATRLTQVLRSCFEDAEHRTALLACVSPCATDVLHTVNTLYHVSMMSAALQQQSLSARVELPLAQPPEGKPIQHWTPEEVVAWLSAAEDGRFANVVLPSLMDGSRLCAMCGVALRQLHAGAMREARRDHEGASWNVAAGRGAIGSALFAAVEREMRYAERMGFR